MARGRILLRALLVLGGLLILALVVRRLFATDAQRIEDAIEEARDALVEHRSDDFMAFFRRDLVYQRDRGWDALRKDVARWEASGLRQVHVADRKIDVRDGSAAVELVVSASAGLYDVGTVRVTLAVFEDDAGDWRVREFRWEPVAR